MSLVIEQPDTQPEQPQKPVTIEGLQKNLYITLAVLVIAALASVVYFYDSLMIAEEQRLTPEQVFKQLLVSGDFDTALALLPPGGGTGAPVEQFARFMTALPAEQLKAAQQAEEAYRNAEGNPAAQASHVNTVIEQLLVSRDKNLYDYFFREESPFFAMKKGTIDASAVALAEYGMTLRPTSVSQVVLSLPHITAINLAKNIDAKGVKEHITAGIEKVEAAAALHAAEVEQMAAGDAQRAHMRMLTWKSSMYGAAALKDQTYLPNLKENAEGAVALYERLVADNGRDNYLQGRIPPILITYAGVLARLGAGHDEQITFALEKIVQFVQGNPQMHEAVFIATVKRLAAQDAKTQGYQYATYKLLATKSEPFKALLAANGLTF